VREKALGNLNQQGFNITLQCMVHRTINFSEMGEIIRLALDTPGVRHVSFMPSRRLGRGLLTTDENILTEFDVMQGIEEQTAGAIRRADWLVFHFLLSLAYRATRSAHLTPRRCFFPLALVGDKNSYAPVTRLRHYLARPWDIAPLMRMLGHPFRFEEGRWHEHSLVVSIETFRETADVDLGDAARCSRFYLVEGGVRQTCVHNTIGR
jgi:uncharacterized radical SAM superfamily Fe-S cluster-containing enzyme